MVVADEIPNLHRFGIGHLIGMKSIDAFWLGALGLDREFVAMVFDHKFDPGRDPRTLAGRGPPLDLGRPGLLLCRLEGAD